QVRQARVDDRLNDYILDLVQATRTHPEIYLGASPRAALALYRASQALALLEGRTYVVPDDIKRLTVAVLAHRLVTKSYRQHERGDAAEQIVNDILAQTPVPG